MSNDNFPILIYRNWLATFTAMPPESVGYIVKDLSCRVLTGEPMTGVPDDLKILSNKVFDEVSEEMKKYSEKKETNKRIAQEREAKKRERTTNELQSYNERTTNVQRACNERDTNDARAFGISKTISKTISNDTNVSINNSSTKTHSRFVPPTLDEIRSYIIEKNYSVDAEAFFNFYESKNWYVGKNKMANWKAAIANWERKEQKEQKKVDPIMDAIMNFGGEDIGK